MTNPKCQMLINANNTILRVEERKMNECEKDTKQYWLHFYRAQEARTLLQVLMNDPISVDLIELERRTADLIEFTEKCGDNHQKHYEAKLKSIMPPPA